MSHWSDNLSREEADELMSALLAGADVLHDVLQLDRPFGAPRDPRTLQEAYALQKRAAAHVQWVRGRFGEADEP